MLDTTVNKWRHVWDVWHPTTCTLRDFLFNPIWNQHIITVEDWQLKECAKKLKITESDKQVIRNLLHNKTAQTAQRALVSYVKRFGKNIISKSCKGFFPAVTAMATFETHRNKHGNKTFTGIVNVDIDGVSFDRAKEIVENWGYVFFLGESITRTGFHILVKVSSDNIKGHLQAISRQLLEGFNITVDPQYDATRLRFYCDNSNGNYYLNEEAKIFEDADFVADDTNYEILQSLGATSKYDTVEYAESCHLKGLAIAAEQLNLEIGDVGDTLHTFISRYQYPFNAYGISLEYAVQFAWDRFFKTHDYVVKKKHKIDKIRADFTNFYRTYKAQHHTLDFDNEKKTSLNVVKPSNVLKLEYGKKLNDLNLQIPKRLILIAPTNSGKTTYFIKQALSGVKTILIVSLQSALEQAKTDHKDIDVFYQFEKTGSNSSNCIVTTYKSFSKVITRLDDLSEWRVVFDEVHNAVLSADHSYRSTEMNEIFQELPKFKEVVLMTGTWVDFEHPMLKEFEKLNVEWRNPPLREYCIHYLALKELYEKVALSCNRKGRHLIYLDDKKEDGKLGKMIEYLSQVNISKDQILIVNSDQKKEAEYRKLITTGKLNQNCKVIIATKIFVESLNLYDEIDEIHILSPLHFAWIHQLATRPRLHVPRLVNLYWSDKNVIDVNHWFNTTKRSLYYQNIASEYLQEFDDEVQDDVLNTLYKSMNRVKGNNLQEHYNTVHKFKFEENNETVYRYGINYLGCAYLANMQQAVAYYKNPLLLEALLKQFNWQATASSFSFNQLLNGVKVSAKMKQVKQVKKSVQKAFVDSIFSSSLENNVSLSDEMQWQIEIRAKIRYISKMLGWNTCKHYVLCNLSLLQNREFNLFMKRIKVIEMLLETSQQVAVAQSSPERIFADFLYNSLTVNQTYSSDQLHEIVCQAIKKHPLYVKKKKYSMKKTYQILTTYMSVSRKQVTENGQRVWKQLIVAHWPLVTVKTVKKVKIVTCHSLSSDLSTIILSNGSSIFV